MLGNRPRSWNQKEDIESNVQTVTIRYKGKAGTGPRRYYIPVGKIEREISELTKLGYNENKMAFVEDPPKDKILLAGEFTREHGGYNLRYTFVKKPMLQAFRLQELYASNLKALGLMRHYMDINSYEWILGLTETYSDSYNVRSCVVEFSTFGCCLGTVPNRNTIIWEVRNY